MNLPDHSGPRLAFRGDQSMVFLHSLISYNRLNVNGLDADGGVGAILGGGMDLTITKRISWRMFEADYVWANHNFSEFAAPAFSELRRPQLNGARLRTGLVFNFGTPEAKAPAAAACSLQPTEVMVGEPITATVNATNFNPKHTLVYNWSSNGGKITGNNTTAAIDTNGVAGGSYTVTARVSDPKAKSGGEASCTSNYTVKEVPKNPPTMSCSANPTSVQTGAPVDRNLHLHQPGQCSGDGVRMEFHGRQRFRQRKHGYSEHHWRFAGYHHGERDLHRLTRPVGLVLGAGHGRESATASAGSQQAERVRLPQQGKTLARGQHLQGRSGRRGPALAA